MADQRWGAVDLAITDDIVVMSLMLVPRGAVANSMCMAQITIVMIVMGDSVMLVWQFSARMGVAETRRQDRQRRQHGRQCQPQTELEFRATHARTLRYGSAT